MSTFKIADGDSVQEALVEVDDVGPTVGIEMFWLDKNGEKEANNNPYACFAPSAARRLADAITQAATAVESRHFARSSGGAEKPSPEIPDADLPPHILFQQAKELLARASVKLMALRAKGFELRLHGGDRLNDEEREILLSVSAEKTEYLS